MAVTAETYFEAAHAIFMYMTDIKKLPKSEIEVRASIPWEEWNRFIDSAVEMLAKTIKVEGFRSGHAPRSIVEQNLGKDSVLNEAANRAIQKQWAHIVESEKIDPIGHPKAEITKLAEGNELSFTIITAVMPVPEMKSGWEKKVSKINTEFSKKKLEVKEEDVQAEMDRLAKSRATFVPVDREARMEDTVRVDFQVLRDRVPIENGTGKNHAIILGSGVFIPGFEERIVGMKSGEENEFELKFPDEYHEKSLAGQNAIFQVKLNSVEERILPELNDSFAKLVGKFETIDGLRTSIREGMEQEMKEKQREEKRSGISDILAEYIDVELPDVMVHEEVHQMLHNFESQLQMMGMNFEEYLKQVRKTREELEKEWEPQARKRILSGLALTEVSKSREIEVGAEEIEAEMNKTLHRYRHIKDAEKQVDMKRLYAYSKTMIESEKAFQFLESL